MAIECYMILKSSHNTKRLGSIVVGGRGGVERQRDRGRERVVERHWGRRREGERVVERPRPRGVEREW